MHLFIFIIVVHQGPESLQHFEGVDSCSGYNSILQQHCASGMIFELRRVRSKQGTGSSTFMVTSSWDEIADIKRRRVSLGRGT